MMEETDRKIRCSWCKGNLLARQYHDREWGVPIHGDQAHFEALTLEIFQCGLNWNLILSKREIFRSCFENFQIGAVAEYGEEDIRRILSTPGMIRSRRKIEATIRNAQIFLQIAARCGSFDRFIWQFTGGKTLLYPAYQGNIPLSNSLSDRVCKALKQEGIRHIGSVTVYSYLEACGIIQDHERSCFRYSQLLGEHIQITEGE